MVIRQTTTIVFEYPQDYLQEQEWCKTKTDEWIHVGTDTRCSIYENKISYSIGQPSSSEKPNNCKDEPQKWETPPKFEHKGITTTCVNVIASRLEYKPQTPMCETCRYDELNNPKCDECIAGKDKPSNYEPQTDCPWK